MDGNKLDPRGTGESDVGQLWASEAEILYHPQWWKGEEVKARERENFTSDVGRVGTSAERRISQPQWRKSKGSGYVTDKVTHVDDRGKPRFG